MLLLVGPWCYQGPRSVCMALLTPTFSEWRPSCARTQRAGSWLWSDIPLIVCFYVVVPLPVRGFSSSIVGLLPRAGKRFGEAGCRALSEALHHNTTLTSLNISSRCLDDADGFANSRLTAWCRCCGCCGCVRAGNNIGAAGCEWLCGALRVNSTLTSLNVGCECDCVRGGC